MSECSRVFCGVGKENRMLVSVGTHTHTPTHRGRTQGPMAECVGPYYVSWIVKRDVSLRLSSRCQRTKEPKSHHPAEVLEAKRKRKSVEVRERLRSAHSEALTANPA